MKKMELPMIVGRENVVLALALDKESKRERVLVGTELNIRLRLEGNETAEVLFDQERPLGTLFGDHDAQDRDWWYVDVFSALRNALVEPKARKGHESTVMGKLQEKLGCDNAISVLVAGRALAYYCPVSSGARNERNAQRMVEKMQILTRSFKTQLLNKDNLNLKKGMEQIGALCHETMWRFETDLRICLRWKKCSQECVMAEDSLVPLLLYYLRRLDDWGMCFRVCEVCGKIFVAENGHFCLCSTDCEKVQNRLNKRAFDKRNKDNRPEQFYQQTRDRIRRMLNEFEGNENTTEEQKELAEKEYQAFRDEAKRRKGSIRSEEDGRAFIGWLYTQEKAFKAKYGGEK